MVSRARQAQRSGPADAGRGTGDDDGFDPQPSLLSIWRSFPSAIQTADSRIAYPSGRATNEGSRCAAPLPSWLPDRDGARIPSGRQDQRFHSLTTTSRKRHLLTAPDSAEAKAFLDLARQVAVSLETASRPAPKIVIE